MYTMKIILVDFLLICVIAEIFATWSPSGINMTSVKTGLTHEEESEQDILDILKNKSILNFDFEGLRDLPIEEILTARPSNSKKKHKKSKKQKKSKKIKSKAKKKPVMITDTINDKDLPNVNNLAPNLYTGTAVDMLSNILGQQTKNIAPVLTELQPLLGATHTKIDNQVKLLGQQKGMSSIFGQTKDDFTKIQMIVPDETISVVDHLPNKKSSKLLGQLQAKYPQKYSVAQNNKRRQIALTKRINDFLSDLKAQLDRANSKKLQGRIGGGGRGLNKFRKFSSTLFNQYNGAKKSDVTYTPINKNIKEKSKTYLEKFKKLLHNVVGKYLNKAVEQSVENVKARQDLYRHRTKRQTQAGYTQDPETCKKYNDNLTKMWSTLSKYLNFTDSVNEIALHNIAVMVEAYLDHKTKKAQENPIDISRDERKKDKISEYLKKIKKILGTDDATEKVKDIILENFKPEYEDDPDCKQINEDNLVSSIGLSYKNYLDNAKCHGDYDTGLLRGKALLRRGPPTKTEIKLTGNFHDLGDNIHKSILNENESSDDFHGSKMPVAKRSRQRNRSLRRIRRSIYHTYNSKKDSHSPKLRSGPLRKSKNVARKKSRGRKRTHVRTDESCVKYANRKFLITLRTSIERFMALRDCQHDDTLRTSNHRDEPSDEPDTDTELEITTINPAPENTTINPAQENTTINPATETTTNNPATEKTTFNPAQENTTINPATENTDTNTEPENTLTNLEPDSTKSKITIVKTITKVPITRTSNERIFNGRHFYSDSQLGQREQNQINNYLSQVKELEGQNPSAMGKPIYVVHSATYKKPILLKIKNSHDVIGQNPNVMQYPIHTHSVQTNYGSSFNPQSKYNQNLDNVYKSFLDSSNVHPKNTFLPTKSGVRDSKAAKQKLRKNINLYEVVKKKVEGKSTTTTTAANVPYEAVARQHDDINNNTFVEINDTNAENGSILLAPGANLEEGSSNTMSIDFSTMGDILNDVRNTSLQTPQIDTISFASENEKGYVELSYLVKYPKSIIYRPQYLVKNILQYEDFVKIANQIYVTDDDKQLLKIVRYLPDNTSQTLFETQDFTSPLEVHDIDISVNDSKKFTYIKENISSSSEVPHLRIKITNETDSYFDVTNQNETDSHSPGASREGPTKDLSNIDLTGSASESYIYQQEIDKIPFREGASIDDLNFNETSIDLKELEHTNNNSALNITEFNFDENGDIDDRILEILNASINSGEFINGKENLDAIEKNASSYNIDDESIADYMRFRLNKAEANLSNASHAYLKELESQGVSGSTLTKSMLRTWWQSWKNKLNNKFQTIRGTVENMLKRFNHNSSTTEIDVVQTRRAEIPFGDD